MSVLRIFPILTVAAAFAAEPVILDWGTLLGSVALDAKLKASNERVSLLRQAPDLGYWDDLELRYEMDGLNLREHKVDLRVTPLGFGERSASKERWSARLEQNEAQRELSLGKALKDRYSIGVEWLYRVHQLSYHQSMLKVYEDRVQVHLSMSGTDRFDPRDLVESQQKLVQLQGSILSDQNDIVELEQILHMLIDGWSSIQLDTLNLLSNSEIRARLESCPQSVDSTFPEYKVALQKMRKLEKDEKLELASKRNYISYAQVGYAWQIPEAGKTDKTTPIEDLSIGVGIRIPFGDSRAQDMFSLQIDRADEKSEMMELQWSLSKDINKMKREIGSLVRQMAVQDSFVSKVDAGALFTDYAMRAGSDPLLLLKARETGLETSWDSEKLRFDAYLLYLDMLEVTGVLSRDPGTNHLKSKK